MDSSFDADELTVVWQTVNVEHACHYCVPAHTWIAKNMGVSDEISNALRNETPLPNARLEALRTFTLSMVRDRGDVGDRGVQASKRQILEVILAWKSHRHRGDWRNSQPAWRRAGAKIVAVATIMSEDQARPSEKPPVPR